METAGGRGGSFGATEESAATGVRRAKRRDSRTEAQCRAALTSPRGLSAHPPGRAGLGAEARASVLAGRESGKKSAAAEEARDFFLPLCFLVHEERGFRAPPKRAPEAGTSRGDQCGTQRRARAAVIGAGPRDGHEMLRLLLPPPRSLCVSTGHSPHRPSWEPVQPATARVP